MKGRPWTKRHERLLARYFQMGMYPDEIGENAPTKISVHNHFPDVESAARVEKAMRRNGSPVADN